MTSPPPSPTRAGIYLRVSDKRQLQGHSLDAQEHLARERAQREGWQVVDVYRDEAQRGGTEHRPEFQRLLADVADKKLDFVIVYHIDRFSREVDSEKHYQLLKQHGVRLVSLTQQLDEDTASGWLMRRIMADFAAYYSKDLGEKYRRGKKQRVISGLSNGDLAFGYRRDPLTKKDEPDPQTAPGVVLMFELYATGEYSDVEVARQVNAAGYRTRSKRGARLFSKDSARDMLQNRFYIGEIKYKGETFPGAHQPIVGLALFERCQQIRATRRTNRLDRANTLARPYPLSHLLYCEECGLRYRGRYHPTSGRIYYHPFRAYDLTCTQKSTTPGARVEGAVVELLSTMTIPPDWLELIRSELTAPQTKNTPSANQQRQALDERAARAKKLFLAGDLTESEYGDEKRALQEQREKLAPPADPPMLLESETDYQNAIELLNNFGQLYRLADDEQRKQLFKHIFEGVSVLSGELAAIQPTRLFYPFFGGTQADPTSIKTQWIPSKFAHLHVLHYARPLPYIQHLTTIHSRV